MNPLEKKEGLSLPTDVSALWEKLSQYIERQKIWEDAGLLKKEWEKLKQEIRKRLPRGGKHLILYTDGASQGNPGPAGVGCVLFNSKGEVLWEGQKHIGEATNNVAEYKALLYGLDKALAFQPEKLTLRLDSELVVRQLKGEYKVKHPILSRLHQEVIQRLWKIPEVTIEHILRRENQKADQLAKKACQKP